MDTYKARKKKKKEIEGSQKPNIDTGRHYALKN